VRAARAGGIAGALAAALLGIACADKRSDTGASAKAATEAPTAQISAASAPTAEAPPGAPAAEMSSSEKVHTLVPRAPTPPTEPQELVDLGRLLFFDPRLSGDNTVACATCHVPERGFTDGRATALGKGGKGLARNTPTVINLASRGPYFLDGRADTLEIQALMPVESPDEMDQDVNELIAELSIVPEYIARFKRALPGEGISISRQAIGRAIAAFERTLVSAGSPYDKKLRGEPGGMSAEAARGMSLFVGQARCVNCHDGPDLTDNSFHNIGVGEGDPGRFAVVQVALMKGAWKTPTLRDIDLTAPYFHDGSAKTLEEVIEHYDRGGASALDPHGHPPENLDPDIKPLGLSAEQKAALVAFMRALTGEGAPSYGVVAPRVPVVPAVTKGSTRALMKGSGGMLETADQVLQSLNEGAWPDVLARAEKLTASAEQIDAIHGPKMDPKRRATFRERAGDLIVRLADVTRLAREKRRAEAAEAYGAVRRACDACHASFREREKAPR
jgi:cytochrome c peroxidase